MCNIDEKLINNNDQLLTSTVEYLEKEVELNLPTQLFESASNAIKEHAKNLQDISNDAMYLQEHGYCTRICMGG